MYLPIRKQLGVNLLELIISVSIISISISLAAPGFNKLIEKNRVIITTNQMITSLHLARSSAVSTSKNVHICRKTTDNRCNTNYPYNADWSDGWLVFIDNNSNANHDPEDTVIQIINNSKNTKIIFNQRGRLRYFPTGFSRSAGFYICGKNRNYFRHIYILRTGRVRYTKELTNRQKSKCD